MKRFGASRRLPRPINQRRTRRGTTARTRSPLFTGNTYLEKLMVESQGLPVEFTGWLDDVTPILRDLDILVVPSAAHDATPRTIRNSDLHHAVDHTPYEGIDVKAWPALTLSRGETVWDGRDFHPRPGRGQFLRRGRPTLLPPRGKPS